MKRNVQNQESCTASRPKASLPKVKITCPRGRGHRSLTPCKRNVIFHCREGSSAPGEDGGLLLPGEEGGSSPGQGGGVLAFRRGCPIKDLPILLFQRFWSTCMLSSASYLEQRHEVEVDLAALSSPWRCMVYPSKALGMTLTSAEFLVLLRSRLG